MLLRCGVAKASQILQRVSATLVLVLMPARRSRSEKDRKTCVPHKTHSHLHHSPYHTSELCGPSRSRQVGIVISGTREYGRHAKVKGRGDEEKELW
jgi:hypothetical protein